MDTSKGIVLKVSGSIKGVSSFEECILYTSLSLLETMDSSLIIHHSTMYMYMYVFFTLYYNYYTTVSFLTYTVCVGTFIHPGSIDSECVCVCVCSLFGRICF